MELTIKNIEFSYDVLPDDTSGYYTHYPAESGKVYIHIHADVKNLQKQDLPCRKKLKLLEDKGLIKKIKSNPLVYVLSVEFLEGTLT